LVSDFLVHLLTEVLDLLFEKFILDQSLHQNVTLIVFGHILLEPLDLVLTYLNTGGHVVLLQFLGQPPYKLLQHLILDAHLLKLTFHGSLALLQVGYGLLVLLVLNGHALEYDLFVPGGLLTLIRVQLAHDIFQVFQKCVVLLP